MSYGVNSFGVGSFGAPIVVSGGAGLSINCTVGTASASGFDATVSNSGLTVTCSLGTATASGFAATVTTIPSVSRKIAFLGDSNGDGRLTNNQPFTGSGSYLYKHDGTVAALADPAGAGPYTYSVFDDAAGTGSLFPRLAQSLLDYIGETILAVPCCKGGTQTSNWTRSTLTSTYYGAMKARIDAVGGVDDIVIFLGANDGIGAVSQATFVSRMNTLIADLHGDFPTARLWLPKIQDFTGYGTQIQAIRAGVQEVWENNANILRGPDFDGITTSVHYTTDADGIAASSRLYNALAGYNVVATIATATASGFDATVSNSSGLTVNCTLGEATASGFDASVSLGLTISCTQGAASASGYTAALEMAYTVAASLGTATASGFYASVTNGSTTLSPADIDAIADAVWSHIRGKFASRFGYNKFITDPATGIATLYDDDGISVLKQWNIFEDVSGLQPYRGRGAERRDPI